MLDQAEQLIVGVGLAQIVIHAQLHRMLAVLLSNTRCDHDDREIAQRRIRADVARQVEAVHAWHFDVGQHHRGALFLQSFQRLQTVGSQHHSVAFALQQALRDAAHSDRVVHHQHQRHLARCRSCRGGHRAPRFGHHIHRHATQRQAAACGAHLFAIHRGQGHRVVNQHHRARSEHRHARQAGKPRQLGPQVFHHHFAVAQHFIHVHGDALRCAAQHHHGAGLAGRCFAAVVRCLKQCTRPEERQLLTRHLEGASAVRRFQLHRGHPAHDFHDIGRHAHRQVSCAQHHHLRHRRGQRKHHAECRTLTRFGGGLDASAERIDLGANHIHPDTAPGKTRHLGGRGEPRQ